MTTNQNAIVTDSFSNPESKALYEYLWANERHVFWRYEQGLQCGGCTYFAMFNSDWGLCCNLQSRHRLETVFEHFTCPSQWDEGWGAHSFGGALPPKR
jgi:hypothetical protein